MTCFPAHLTSSCSGTPYTATSARSARGRRSRGDPCPTPVRPAGTDDAAVDEESRVGFRTRIARRRGGAADYLASTTLLRRADFLSQASAFCFDEVDPFPMHRPVVSSPAGVRTRNSKYDLPRSTS